MINKIYNREIKYGTDCKKKMMEGIDILTKAVGSTMGPAGKNVVIKLGAHDPRFTKDGVTVARNVFSPDPWINLGMEIVSGVALRTNDRCGDGTTTATVLAHALCKNHFDMKEVYTVIANLRDMSRPVDGKPDWYDVALVSSNNDMQIASLIADTIEQVGIDGQITVESGGDKLTAEIVGGMSFASGYASPFFVTDTKKMVAELEDVKIFMMSDTLMNLPQIFDRLNNTVKNNESLLILAPDIGGEALKTLILNKVKNGIRVCAVKIGTLAPDFIDDIKILVGNNGDLGKAKKVIVSHNKTIIIDGDGDVTERVTFLRENNEKARLARLTGGVAILKVGGTTEAEIEERRDRVEDALNATRSAIEEGIVVGGGMALYEASRNLPDGPVKAACEAPIRQILTNSGLNLDITMAEIKKCHTGLNVRTKQYDMTGIVDPTKVVCSALLDAASVANLILNTEAGIVELQDGK